MSIQLKMCPGSKAAVQFQASGLPGLPGARPGPAKGAKFYSTTCGIANTKAPCTTLRARCRALNFTRIVKNLKINTPGRTGLVRNCQNAYSMETAAKVSVFSLPTGTTLLFLTVYDATSARAPMSLVLTAETDSE